jgi:hypothetical protein
MSDPSSRRADALITSFRSALTSLPAVFGATAAPLSVGLDCQAETKPLARRFPPIPARSYPPHPLVHRAEDFESALVALYFCSLSYGRRSRDVHLP